jgi:hypothetical protein
LSDSASPRFYLALITVNIKYGYEGSKLQIIKIKS